MPPARPQGRLRHQRGRSSTLLRPALVLCLVLAFLAPGLAGAGLIKPWAEAGLGYDDNVRLKQEARADGFVQGTAGLTVDMGPETNRLELSGALTYAQYFRLTDESGIQSGNAGVRWRRRFSPAWMMELSNRYNTTVDPVEETDTGAIARVRNTSSRRDRDTTRIMGEYRWGDMSRLSAGYTYTWTDSSEENDDVANYHQVDMGFSQRLGTDHRVEADGKAVHDDYQTTPDVNRTNLSARLVRMFGPLREAFVGLSYDRADSLSDDPVVTKARDYQTYGAQLGWVHKVSPALDYRLVGGWSQVDADSKANASSGKGYPTMDAKITYRQKKWEAEAHATASLGEYDFLGDNSGLTVTQRVGGSWRWNFAKHWFINLLADYIHDDYEQDPTLADTSGTQGVVDTTRVGMILRWQLSKDLALKLDYRYLNRDAEQDDDDRSQNRVLLLLTSEWPRRW